MRQDRNKSKGHHYKKLAVKSVGFNIFMLTNNHQNIKIKSIHKCGSTGIMLGWSLIHRAVYSDMLERSKKRIYKIFLKS